ncbi:sugar ABC transporter permease [Mesotoga sp.]|uniref:carbohydrate ABC transporter permease n=1 Tax=Mesotoga sp. TaxID=2053577 RepID=UPI001BD51A02|nr:sugar ABC transporter permease [Mesotoga sp.]
MTNTTKQKLVPMVLNLPALIIFALVILYPIIKGISLSFHNTQLLMPPGTEAFIGLRNYEVMLRQDHFWNSLKVTAIYTTGVVLVSYLIGLGTALLLNSNFRGRKIARVLMILPWAVPEVAAVMTWRWILDYQYGIMNSFMASTGLIGTNLGWLVDPQLSMVAVIMVTVWVQFPLATLMMLAGLQAISQTLREAALIDGANKWQVFWNVTMPGLKSVNVVLILLLTLYSFKRVTLIFLMTGGGPSRATEVLSILTYQQAFKNYRLGYASAIGTVMLVIMLAFSIIYLMVLSRRGKETS